MSSSQFEHSHAPSDEAKHGTHVGGCLCGQTRYNTKQDPLWVTICYCRFCQQATGSDRMIEPIYDRAPFVFVGQAPKVFELTSQGSGKAVQVHFCAQCGTKLALTFERWPDRIGLYSGTLDDPAALVVTPETAKHIFTSEARPGTILPAEFKTFDRHASENDGSPIEPKIFDMPFALNG